MPGYVLLLMGALPGAGLALLFWQRWRMADRAAADAVRWAEGRGRCLGLLAQELQGAGLALLGGGAARADAAGPAIAAEGGRLLRLADDVSDYLAAEAGPRRLDLCPVPLVPLLEEAVAAIAIQLGAGQRAWRLAPDFAELTLRVDRRALRGALLQVLARTARMTREGDQIDLRPVLTPDTVAIVVEDEGAGLPAEDLGTGTPDGTRGLGFGLAVARSLLEAHGGALRMEALPGVGARAWLTLPRHCVVAA